MFSPKWSNSILNGRIMEVNNNKISCKSLKNNMYFFWHISCNYFYNLLQREKQL